MSPWEKRLKDLSRLLENCHSTYMDPDLFRMNTNQFLQTARTVTFIIQKNKDTIPSFSSWYSNAVLTPWRNDEIMTWAKDARNTIEKEGDLELNSSLQLTLVFSYLEEQDAKISCGKAELLNAGIQKLVRFAIQRLPSGVSDAAVVKIERRWVTAQLPTLELLQALVYVYARLLDACKSLAMQLGTQLNCEIPDVGSFDSIRDETRQVSYFKLNDFSKCSRKTETIFTNRKLKPPKEIRAAFETIKSDYPSLRSLDEVLEYYSKMAELTFAHFGSHIPSLCLFNECWQPLELISTHFTDQADKFIFWRDVADRILNLKAYGLIWICEAWVRSNGHSGATAVRNMPVTGERLQLAGVEKSGYRSGVEWEIVRDAEAAKPKLRLMPSTKGTSDEVLPYFLVPAMRALGISNPDFMVNPGVG